MTRKEFLAGATPLRLRAPDTGALLPMVYLTDGPAREARWVIRDRTQRLRKYDAYAKDARVYEGVILPLCARIVILDCVDDKVRSIETATFDREKWLLVTKSGEQWACDRRWWSEERPDNPKYA